MVTLSLFDTLLALQCEDLMAELLLKFLVPGRHIPAAHRHKVNRIDGYALAIDHFLELSPEVMKLQLPADASAASSAIGAAPRSLHQQQQLQPNGGHAATVGISKTIGANWNHYGVHTGDSLYANYRAYLFDARQRIGACQRNCARWSHGYRLAARTVGGGVEGAKQKQRSARTMGLIRDFLSEFSDTDAVAAASSPISATGGKQLDSLQSLGESSGYESFKYRVEEDDSSGEDRRLDRTGASCSSDEPQQRIGNSSWKTSSRRRGDSDSGWDVSMEAATAAASEADDEGSISLGEWLI